MNEDNKAHYSGWTNAPVIPTSLNQTVAAMNGVLDAARRIAECAVEYHGTIRGLEDANKVNWLVRNRHMTKLREAISEADRMCK